MAIESQAALKARVALGTTTTVLFDNMIDSLGHPQDSNGNDVLTRHTNIGNVFDSSKWVSDWYTLDIGETGSYVVTDTTDVITGYNFYYDGTNYRFKYAGFSSQKVETSTGVIIERVSSVSGAADDIISLVEIKRTNADGNIAYNGATIPADVSATFKHTFYTNDSARIETNAGNGTYYMTSGMYINSSDFLSLTGAANGRVNTFGLIIDSVRRSTNAVPVAGATAVLETIYTRDENGSINILTGETYTATL